MERISPPVSKIRTPHKLLFPTERVEALDTHGQSWSGDTVKESIALCPHQLIEPYFLKYLPRKGKILEAGCGLGRWVFYLRSLGYDIIGIDLASEALRIVKAYDPQAPIYAENILHTAYPEKSFHAIISLGVVEHFEEGPQKAFRETYRLLTDDGLFFVTVPINNLSRRLIANPLKGLKRWIKKRGRVQYAFEEYRYTRQEFQILLEESGFEIFVHAPDEFKPPMNIGLYVDYPLFRHRSNKWELNGLGEFVNSILTALNPWINSAGALWICRKKKN
ncbi:MAG: class I SAM-dependent methyltransferase [Bacteroidota bacterium]